MTDVVNRRARWLGSVGVEAGLAAGGGAAEQLSRLAVSIVAAGVLGPVVFGSWSLISVLVQYANVFSLGVAAGAARAVPVALGAGDDAHALRLEGAAKAAGAATSLLAAVVTMALAALLLFSRADWGVLILVGCAAFIQQQVALQQALLRGRFMFHRAASAIVAQGVVGLGLGLLLVSLGLIGLVASRVLAGLSALAVSASATDRRSPSRWDTAVALDLIRQGFPIAAASAMFGALITLDRWIVLLVFGDEAVGQYSLASIVLVGLLMIPILVSQQVLARTAFRFGSDKDEPELRRRALHQGLLAGGLTAAAAVLIVTAAALFVPRFLPAYEPSLMPMAISAVGATGYAFVSGYPTVLGILRLGRRLVIVQAGALIVLVVLAAAFTTVGLGMGGVSLATALSLTGYGVATAAAARIGRSPALDLVA
jgi:O-antigen/teichoic acid export membrane protein